MGARDTDRGDAERLPAGIGEGDYFGVTGLAHGYGAEIFRGGQNHCRGSASSLPRRARNGGRFLKNRNSQKRATKLRERAPLRGALETLNTRPRPRIGVSADRILGR